MSRVFFYDARDGWSVKVKCFTIHVDRKFLIFLVFLELCLKMFYALWSSWLVTVFHLKIAKRG